MQYARFGASVGYIRYFINYSTLKTVKVKSESTFVDSDYFSKYEDI
jgi:hypothetical protein